MLVLSRKKNESIVIDENISIIIIEIRGDKVRLGIDAPKDVTVHRKEVFDTIQSSELESVETATGVTGVSSEKEKEGKASGRKGKGKKPIHG